MDFKGLKITYSPFTLQVGTGRTAPVRVGSIPMACLHYTVPCVTINFACPNLGVVSRVKVLNCCCIQDGSSRSTSLVFVAIPETEYCHRDAGKGGKGEGENKSEKENAALISHVVCSYSQRSFVYTQSKKCLDSFKV